jgi:hypothetical protein
MPAAYREIVRNEFTLRNLRRWRLIQVASILPLILCLVWMFYFRGSPEIGVMIFFLILVVGVLYPEVKGDIAQLHVILREEHIELRKEIQDLLKEELRKLLNDPEIQNMIKEDSSSSGEPTPSK